MKMNAAVRGIGLSVAGLALLGTGCVSWWRGGAASNELSVAAIEAFLERTSDPRMYSISASKGPVGEVVYTGAFRPQHNASAVVPFASDPASDVPLLPVRFGATAPGTLLTDTTAPENWVAFETAQSQRFTPIGPGGKVIAIKPAHVVDPTEGFACICPALFLGDLRFDAVVLYARAAPKPLWPVSRSPAAQEADAVLGMSALRAFAHVQWDFKQRQVTFSASLPYTPDPDRVIAEVPVEGGMRVLMVMGRVDGERRPLLIDTAGDYELVMQEPPAGMVQQVSLGDVVFRQVRAEAVGDRGLTSPQFARVGIGLLSRYRVTLDNRRNLLIFETPAPAPTP